MKLDNTTVAITGAASGIGRALAERLAHRGCSLALADVEPAPLEDVVAELSQITATVGMVTDVGDAAQVEQFAAATVAEFGGVDVAVNNAGVSTFNLIQDQTVDDWRWVVDVNLMGVVHGIAAFLPRLATRPRAHLVNVASVAGIQSGIAFLGPYAATKAAVVSISETLHQELAAYQPHVSVTVLCPANTDTAVMRSERNRPAGLPVEQRRPDAEAWRSGIEDSFTGPTGRTPDDVAIQLIDGIEADRLFVLTHAEMAPVLTQRLQRVIDAVESESARVGG
ncbi:MAG: SDR family NAD(P)-dependent oxidoreductase, partial [Acidimicrobiales bacterium]